MSVRKQTLFLTLTTAVMFLSIISILSIMSSGEYVFLLYCTFILLTLFKPKRDFIKLYLNKTDTFLLESLMHDVIQTGAFKRTSANKLTATSTL